MLDSDYASALIVRTKSKTIKNYHIMENIETIQNVQNAQDVILVREESQKNTAASVGFVCALIGMFLSWVPVLGWVMWITGLVGSIVGLFKEPRGKAIAGLVISFIDLIILVTVVGAIAMSL